MLTDQGFAAAMAVLCDSFGTVNFERSATMRQTWMMLFSDLTDLELQTAVALYCRNGNDWPTPAKLRKIISMDDGLESRPTVAWSVVLDSISKVGGYVRVAFDDDLTTATIRRMGGWRKLCETPTDELKWVEKDFAKVYRALQTAGVSADDIKALPGEFDKSDATSGHGSTNSTVQIKVGLPNVRLKITDAKTVHNLPDQRNVAPASQSRVQDSASGRTAAEWVAGSLEHGITGTECEAGDR